MAETWEEENNEIVRIAKAMSTKLRDMADFARNQGMQPAGSIKVSFHMLLLRLNLAFPDLFRNCVPI